MIFFLYNRALKNNSLYTNYYLFCCFGFYHSPLCECVCLSFLSWLFIFLFYLIAAVVALFCYSFSFSLSLAPLYNKYLELINTQTCVTANKLSLVFIVSPFFLTTSCWEILTKRAAAQGTICVSANLLRMTAPSLIAAAFLRIMMLHTFF